MRAWHVILVAGVIALLSLLYQGLWGDPRAIPTVLIGTQAPTLSGPTVITGETLSMDQYRGKVIMLNFWASWCLECQVEHESLLEIHRQFGEHPDFVMLGINYQDRVQDARKYLDDYGTRFAHVRDQKGTISIDYGVYGVPETFVMDRQGVIVYKYVGPIVGPTYTHLTENIIRPLLQGNPSTVS